MQYLCCSQDSAWPAWPAGHRDECLSRREGLPASLGLRAVIPTLTLVQASTQAPACVDEGTGMPRSWNGQNKVSLIRFKTQVPLTVINFPQWSSPTILRFFKSAQLK